MDTNELVMQYCGLVKQQAKKWTSSRIPFEDLVQEGIIGLLEAAKRFDKDRGCQFSTYAIPWVKKYMREYVARFRCSISTPPYAKANLLIQMDLKDGIESIPDKETPEYRMAEFMRYFSDKEKCFINAQLAGYTNKAFSERFNYTRTWAYLIKKSIINKVNKIAKEDD